MKATVKENLAYYFDLLNKCFKENCHKNHPEKIYNTDETGIPLYAKSTKVLGVKGQRDIDAQETKAKSLSLVAVVAQDKLCHHLSYLVQNS